MRAQNRGPAVLWRTPRRRCYIGRNIFAIRVWTIIQEGPMAGTDAPEDRDTVANHTLAHLRSHGKKLDLLLETLGRHGERLSRVERDVGEARRDVGEARRDVGEARRDISEIKSDIALLENRFLSTQTEVLSILHRLDRTAAPTTDGDDDAAPQR
jgi:chromosome segregation ATPase